MNSLGDGVPVHCATLECVQNQQIKRSLEQNRLGRFSHLDFL